MVEFRIFYSSQSIAEEKGLPAKGTLYTINTIEDLLALQVQLNCDLIIHEAGYEPWWVDGDPDFDDSGNFIEHTDWKGARWIEVYNYLRE